MLMVSARSLRMIELAVLGRPFRLGMLYDCRTEQIFPGVTLWDELVMKQNLISQEQKTSSFEIITSDTYSHKAKALEVNDNLKLSLFGKLVDVSGSAKYFNDRTESEHQQRVSLYYKCTTKFESLSMSELAKGKSDFENATHVITSIMYGNKAFLIFDRKHASMDSKSKDSFKDLIQKIPSYNRKMAETSVSGKTTESIDVKFYGDFLAETNPTTFREAVELYHMLPDLLKTDKNPSIPLIAWLYPLAGMKSINDIDSNIVNSVEKFFDQIHECEIKCNDLLETSACKHFDGLKDDITQFKKMLSEYKAKIQDHFSRLIPNVRSKKNSESCLNKTLENRKQSPFSEKAILAWLKEKHNESISLSKYIDEKGDIQFVKANNIGHFCSNPEFEYILCLTILRQEHDPHLTAMNDYLESKAYLKLDAKYNGECLLDVDLSTQHKTVETKRTFKTLYQASLDNKDQNIMFMVTEEKSKEYTNGAFIYIYQKGKLIDRNFIPPSAPTMLSVSDIRHDQVTLKWQNPSKTSKYLMHYQISCSEGGELVRSDVKSDQAMVSNLKLGKKYTFRIQSYFIGGHSQYTEAKTITTLPTSEPGKPEVSQISTTKALLQWNRPVSTAKSSEINYKILRKVSSNNGWSEIDQVKDDPKLNKMSSVISISPNEQYEFLVRADCAQMGKGLESPLSDVFQSKPAMNALLLEKGCPTIYKLNLTETMVNEDYKIRKCILGEKNRQVHEKVIMMIGETGTGKTTLINGIMNILLGIEWKDDIRYKLINETQKKGKSVTEKITSYTIHQQQGFSVPYTLTVVDTPGFGDTEGKDKDNFLTKQIDKFFRSKGDSGIDQIDAIGFAVKSSTNRLTENQKYIFNSILDLFGKDIKENIYILATFTDTFGSTGLKDCIQEAKLPYKHIFEFNNGHLFEKKSSISEQNWNESLKSYKLFLNKHLNEANPKSLQLSSEVLHERRQLEVYLQGIQEDIQMGLNKCRQLQQEKLVVETKHQYIQQKSDIQYDVMERIPVQVTIPIGTNALSCTYCTRTCHYPCSVIFDNTLLKYTCSAMTWGGKCTVCGCKLTIHNVDTKHRYIHENVVKKRKLQDIIAEYTEDSKLTEIDASAISEKIKFELRKRQHSVAQLAHLAKLSLEKLNMIALRPSSPSTIEYIDGLINTETSDSEWTDTVKQIKSWAENMEGLGAPTNTASTEALINKKFILDE